MLERLGALATVLIFPLFCWNCIGNNAASIAATLQSNVAGKLAAAAIVGGNVKADGRDIVLTGRVPTEADRTTAGDLARSTSGVRTVDNQLTVGANAQAVQSQINKILLDKKIEFEANKNVLLPASIPVLEEVLSVLNVAPGLNLRVEGYTDNSGSADSNRTLSQARAEAVANWLSEHGIARDRMKATGFGPDKPLVPNTTPENRALNRRVEILAN